MNDVGLCVISIIASYHACSTKIDLRVDHRQAIYINIVNVRTSYNIIVPECWTSVK